MTEYGTRREYYQLFTSLGCVTGENLKDILADIGEDYPEMKAFFLRYQEETVGTPDFFAGLEL